MNDADRDLEIEILKANILEDLNTSPLGLSEEEKVEVIDAVILRIIVSELRKDVVEG